MRNILYLYSELGPYNIPVFRQLVSHWNANITVIHWDERCLKPYSVPEVDGVRFIKRSAVDKSSITKLISDLNPAVVYISGWMDKTYLKSILPYRRKGGKVVVGFDDIWVGSIRQYVGSIYFKFWLKRYFTHAWVAGEYQFEYARKLGFSKDNIIFDLLSADVDRFSSANYSASSSSFLYVGNFRTVKGTDLLAKAFSYYKNELGGEYDLICIGNGELKGCLSQEGITVVDYMSQERLLEYVDNSVTFVLPSVHDQWGVVVHEFASAGLPLIVSSGVGSKTKFVINGYNGFIFENGDVESLARKFLAIEKSSLDKRKAMSSGSLTLSSRVSPETSAANLMSLV